MADLTIAQLEEQLTKEKQAFALQRTALMKALEPLKPSPDAVDALLSYAEEYGADYASRALTDSMMTSFGFGKPASRSQLVQLRSLFKATALHLQTMDDLVLRREDKLRQQDPKRDRVYIFLGREFTIDAHAREMAYLDGEKVKIELTAPSPKLPARNRDRERDHDREDRER